MSVREFLLSIVHIINDSDHSALIYGAFCVLIFYLIFKLTAWVDKMIVIMFHRRRKDYRRDAERLFTREERIIQSHKCNNRCEGTGLLFRCRYTGDDLQGDHWYPHARGGATTMKNLVMLCPKCNRRKSDKVPSIFQTEALYLRRKLGYGYAHHMDKTHPGEWIGRNYINRDMIENKKNNSRPTF